MDTTWYNLVYKLKIRVTITCQVISIVLAWLDGE